MQSTIEDQTQTIQAQQRVTDRQMASFSARQIIGSNVYDEQDRELGNIHDIMISASGKIAYIVLSYGGVFGTTLGDKRFAIPYHAFRTKHIDGDLEFTLSVDKSVLENAPGFDKDYMPNFADPAFARTIDKYYKEYNGQREMTYNG
jgi:hypothetical protein